MDHSKATDENFKYQNSGLTPEGAKQSVAGFELDILAEMATEAAPDKVCGKNAKVVKVVNKRVRGKGLKKRKVLDQNTQNKLVGLKFVKSRVKAITRRSIIRGTKTAWIFYCNQNRKNVLEDDPSLSFGDVCKRLAPMWKSLSASEKQPYNILHRQDQERFQTESLLLSTEQKKTLKKIKRVRRELKKKLPRSGLSPYMYFVIRVRNDVVHEHPTADFQTVGKMLGQRWNRMTVHEKEPYLELSQKDKERYRQECAVVESNVVPVVNVSS